MSNNKTLSIDFGHEGTVSIGPTEVDASRLGYFDELEYECWALLKSYLKHFGFVTKKETDVDDDIDFCAAKTLQDFILEMFEREGVIFKFSDDEKADNQKVTAPLYAVMLDWSHDCESGVECLCITNSNREAHQIMEDAIRREKENSWISDVDEKDVGDDDKNMYVEEVSQDKWSFYLNGCYSTKHTDITLYEKHSNSIECDNSD